jgi:hypothetical protein
MSGTPIEQSCFWLSRRTPRPVALWTALFVNRLDPSAEVVSLEQEVAAYGASGRTRSAPGSTHPCTWEVRRYGAVAFSTR